MRSQQLSEDEIREVLGDEMEPERSQDIKRTQAQILIELADGIELFHTPEHDCYATFAVGTHHETWPLRSKAFRRYLVQKFYQSRSKPPGSQALQDAIQLLEARAQYDGDCHPVYTRIGGHNGNIYLDLADESWRAVEITATGWRVAVNPPVKFRRASGMLPLPRPVSTGSVEELRTIINYGSQKNWILINSWLLAALRPEGPYPVMVILAEHGAAKSTLELFVRSLIDPSVAPLRTAPRNEEDLMIAARNSWVIALDNLSFLLGWLSDGLCRVATGGGLTKRQLYTDAEEQILNAQRPVMVNSIESVVERTDLVDRSLIIELPRIPDHERRPIEQIKQRFDEKAPGILGALLTAVSEGLKNQSSVELRSLPRMADFAKWITACEPALPWQSGDFLTTYQSNRKGAIDKTLDADLIGSAIRKLMESRDEWEGTASELLDTVENITDQREMKSKAWPKSANSLSRKLKRSTTFLRAIGVEITFPADGDKPRLITIRKDTQDIADIADTEETPIDAESQSRDKPAIYRDTEKDIEEVKPNSGAGSRDNYDIRDKKHTNSNSNLWGEV